MPGSSEASSPRSSGSPLSLTMMSPCLRPALAAGVSGMTSPTSTAGWLASPLISGDVLGEPRHLRHADPGQLHGLAGDRRVLQALQEIAGRGVELRGVVDRAHRVLRVVEPDRRPLLRADQADGLSLGVEDGRAEPRQPAPGSEHLRHLAAQRDGHFRLHEITLIACRLRQDAHRQQRVADLHRLLFKLQRLPVAARPVLVLVFGPEERQAGSFVPADEDGFDLIGVLFLAGNDDLELLHLGIRDARVENGDGAHHQPVLADDDPRAGQLAPAQLAFPGVLHRHE